jgi:peptidoglycan hydrolase CwlO-like protein
MGNLFQLVVIPWYVKLLAAIVLIGAVVGNNVLLTRQLNNKEKMLNQANTKIETIAVEYKTTVDTLKKSIDLQNAAVIQYQQEAQDAKDQIDNIARKAALAKSVSDQKVVVILSQTKPTSCQTSIDSLVDIIPSLQWTQK